MVESSSTVLGLLKLDIGLSRGYPRGLLSRMSKLVFSSDSSLPSNSVAWIKNWAGSPSGLPLGKIRWFGKLYKLPLLVELKISSNAFLPGRTVKIKNKKIKNVKRLSRLQNWIDISMKWWLTFFQEVVGFVEVLVVFARAERLSPNVELGPNEYADDNSYVSVGDDVQFESDRCVVQTVLASLDYRNSSVIVESELTDLGVDIFVESWYIPFRDAHRIYPDAVAAQLLLGVGWQVRFEPETNQEFSRMISWSLCNHLLLGSKFMDSSGQAIEHRILGVSPSGLHRAWKDLVIVLRFRTESKNVSCLSRKTSVVGSTDRVLISFNYVTEDVEPWCVADVNITRRSGKFNSHAVDGFIYPQIYFLQELEVIITM